MQSKIIKSRGWLFSCCDEALAPKELRRSGGRNAPSISHFSGPNQWYSHNPAGLPGISWASLTLLVLRRVRNLALAPWGRIRALWHFWKQKRPVWGNLAHSMNLAPHQGPLCAGQGEQGPKVLFVRKCLANDPRPQLRTLQPAFILAPGKGWERLLQGFSDVRPWLSSLSYEQSQAASQCTENIGWIIRGESQRKSLQDPEATRANLDSITRGDV